MAVATKPKSTTKTILDPRKVYWFELFENNDSLVPRGPDGHQRAPYPPIWVASSAGLGIHPVDGDMQEWRYIHSHQQTIWKSDQPLNMSKSQIEDPRNEIVFRNGRCIIRGIEPAKMEALKIQDAFAKCVNPINAGAPKRFFLVDQEEINQTVKETLDDAYEAEKQAREMDLETMYALASLFGINLNQTDKGIRTEMIIKSKEHPKAFLRDLVDPKHKIRFLMLRALQENVISTSVIEGKVVWVDTGNPLFDIKVDVDAANELAKMWAQGNEKVKNLVDRIRDLFKDNE